METNNNDYFRGITTAEIKTLKEDIKEIKEDIKKMSDMVFQIESWKNKVIGISTGVAALISLLVSIFIRMIIRIK